MTDQQTSRPGRRCILRAGLTAIPIACVPLPLRVLGAAVPPQQPELEYERGCSSRDHVEADHCTTHRWIARRLCDYRNAQGWSVDRLADALYWDRQDLARFLAGRGGMSCDLLGATYGLGLSARFMFGHTHRPSIDDERDNVPHIGGSTTWRSEPDRYECMTSDPRPAPTAEVFAVTSRNLGRARWEAVKTRQETVAALADLDVRLTVEDLERIETDPTALEDVDWTTVSRLALVLARDGESHKDALVRIMHRPIWKGCAMKAKKRKRRRRASA